MNIWINNLECVLLPLLLRFFFSSFVLYFLSFPLYRKRLSICHFACYFEKHILIFFIVLKAYGGNQNTYNFVKSMSKFKVSTKKVWINYWLTCSLHMGVTKYNLLYVSYIDYLHA